FADWERRFLFHKAHSLKDEPIAYVRQSDVCWNVSDALPDDGSVKNVEELESMFKVAGAGIYLCHTWQTIVPALFKQARPGHAAYAWTYVYSPEERDAGALVEFQNYSRSERDMAPPAGEWDYKGSRAWLNGEEIKAPLWKNAGKAITNEDLLLDENATARPPVQVKLRKGWNRIVLKLPYKTLPREQARLNKWMFTFALTDPDGRNALEGIRYSTEPTPVK
ncbi:MAG: hypothetical protein HUJ94_00285, partial [Bacteroidales bacterium]|nr:hypothetical protein [Bacteroidales bacterium]